MPSRERKKVKNMLIIVKPRSNKKKRTCDEQHNALLEKYKKKNGTNIYIFFKKGKTIKFGTNGALFAYKKISI